MEKIFKAKRIDNGEWVEFNLEGIRGNNFVYVSGLGMLNVDLKKCCQYTGINDSQGNRIFEGDIFIEDDFYSEGKHLELVVTPKDSQWLLVPADKTIEPDTLYNIFEYLRLTGHNIHDRG